MLKEVEEIAKEFAFDFSYLYNGHGVHIGIYFTFKGIHFTITPYRDNILIRPPFVLSTGIIMNEVFRFDEPWLLRSFLQSYN